MPGDVEPGRNPGIIVRGNVVQETGERGRSSGSAGQSAVQALSLIHI